MQEQPIEQLQSTLRKSNLQSNSYSQLTLLRGELRDHFIARSLPNNESANALKIFQLALENPAKFQEALNSPSHSSSQPEEQCSLHEKSG